MANRRRGTYSLPEELQTSARLSTKKVLNNLYLSYIHTYSGHYGTLIVEF